MRMHFRGLYANSTSTKMVTQDLYHKNQAIFTFSVHLKTQNGFMNLIQVD